MESNSAHKDRARPINDYLNETPKSSVPEVECHSEFLKNLKKQQQVQQPGMNSPPNQMNGQYLPQRKFNILFLKYLNFYSLT
jgi:hypothetical protein